MKTNSWTLKSKLALVTGASKGIGKAVCEEFLSLGANLIFVARNETEIRKLEEEWKAQGFDVEGVSADISSAQGRKKIKEALDANGQGLDILVNNAATTIRKKLHEYDEEEYRGIIELNVISLVELCRLVFPYLKYSRSPSVVNLASVAGIVDIQSGAPYGVTKAAVIQLSRNLAAEWAEYGIRVNTVSPWYTATEMAAPVLADPERLNLILSRTPLGKVGQPEDIAAAVAFLCMDKAGHITGQNLAVDGGFLVKGL